MHGSMSIKFKSYRVSHSLPNLAFL